MKYYLDSNVFIYYEISNDIKRDLSKKVLLLMEKGLIEGVTSCLTVDEVVWKVGKEIDRDIGIEVGNKMLELPNLEMLPINEMTVNKALKEMKKSDLKPRDAIHVASMLENDVFYVISEDKDFDKVEGIERFELEELLKKFEDKEDDNKK